MIARRARGGRGILLRGRSVAARRRDGSDPIVANGAPLRGLTVTLDPLRLRHVHRAAAATRDITTRELGALRTDPGEDRMPVWLDDGRLLCEPLAPSPSPPSRAALLRWVLEPVTVREAPSWVERARRLAARTVVAVARPWRRAPASGAPAEPPAGYLHRSAGPGTLPLFSALHRITRDQILTTDPTEATDLGYDPPKLVGHIVAAAPATTVLVRRAALAPIWAGLGPPGGARPHAAGGLTHPGSRSHGVQRIFRVAGWALLADEGVARVECFVDGRMAGRARLGLPRRTPRRLWRSPEALVCGFDLWVNAPDTRPGAPIEVEALVTGMRGSRFVMATTATPVSPEPLPADWRRASSDGPRPMPSHPPEDRAEAFAADFRLLAFTHRLDAGGAQRYLCEQVARLAAGGDVTAVVVSAEDGEWRGYLEAAGVEVRIASGYPTGTVDEYEQGMRELRELVDDERFDVALVNTLVSFPGADLASRLGVPTAWAIHESYEIPMWWAMVSDTAPPYPQARLERAVERADALVFAAEATRALYRAHAAEDRMLLAPYGLETEDLDDFRRDCDAAALRGRLGLPQDAEIVMCLSVIDPRKGQVPLARAFAEVAHRHPKAHLVLVGGRDSPYCDALERYVRGSAVADRCTIVPLTMDVYPWHAVADVFALASNVESSPIAILEAMAFETPVVAPRIFGIPELITDGRDGYLFEESDVADLARTLDRVLAIEPAGRRAVGLAGSRRVRERHDPDRYGANMERLLRGLAEDPAAPPLWSSESSDGAIR